MTGPLLTHRGVVYPADCDQMGHMNVSRYVAKFDEGTWNLFTALGMTPSWMRANARGMAAVEQRILYKKELLAGDAITVHSEVLEVGDKVLRFRHEMRKQETGEVAALTTLTTVCLDAVARRACPFPPEIRKKAAEMIVRK